MGQGRPTTRGAKAAAGNRPVRPAAWLAALLSMAAACAAWADADGERAALARLVGEVDALEPLLREAERQADARDRSRFAYDLLRADLEHMKEGIREHLERPRTEPRAVAPLPAGYRRQGQD